MRQFESQQCHLWLGVQEKQTGSAVRDGIIFTLLIKATLRCKFPVTYKVRLLATNLSMYLAKLDVRAVGIK